MRFFKASRKSQGFISLAFSIALGIGGLSSLSIGLIGKQLPSKNLQTPQSSLIKTKNNVPTLSNLPPSKPANLEILAIKVSSDFITVGKNTDGTVEVPKGENEDKVAWYKYSATPGELGSTVILGHIDSNRSGPSVFFKLAELKSGDKVIITREDKIKVTYVVNAVQEIPKNRFPTQEVYSLGDETLLRMISCGGEFDKSINDYTSNIIVSASFLESDNDGSAPIAPAKTNKAVFKTSVLSFN